MDDSGAPEELGARAARRLRRLAVGTGVLAVVALAAGFAVGAARSDRPGSSLLPRLLIGLAVLAVLAGIMVAMVVAVRRRGAELASPLWGADHSTRARVVRAIRRQEELTGLDRRLALVETARIRRLGRALLVVMTFVTVLVAASLVLLIVGGASAGRIALGAGQLALVAGFVAYQAVLYRRAGTYLTRFAPTTAPRPGSG